MNKKKTKNKLRLFQEARIKNEFSKLIFYVVLVQPETGANVGSVARVMENFSFNNLILFNPIEKLDKIFSYHTQGYAMHGKDILYNAEVITVNNQENYLIEFENFLKRFDLILATTAKGQHFRNIRRLAIFPEDLIIPASKKSLKIAILFGKESRGLTNNEISLADISIRIPTDENYPTMNISHACAIILYEIYKKINFISLGRGGNPILLADKEDRLFLYKLILNLIKKLKIRTHKKENVLFAFKNIFERALMSKKELSLIIGIFSKVNSILKEKYLYEK